MARPTTNGAAIPRGVGLGLRIEFAGELFADENAPVDFLEIHPENYVDRGGAHQTMLERASERFPFVTHGLTMGFGNVEPVARERLASLRGLLDRVSSGLHSDHFCFASSRGRFAHELLPVPFDRETRDIAVDRIRRMRDAIDRPVAIENVSYYVPRARDPLDEIEALSDVLDRADAALLLDVNNVVVNAHNLGFDPRSWLDRVPYDRVAQIHVAGHLIRPDGLRIDTHGSRVDTEVMVLLAEVLRRTGPVPVLLERDSEMPAYDEIVRELRELRSIYDDAMSAREERLSSVIESRSHEVRGALDVEPRAGEPTRLGTLEDAIVDHLLAPDVGSLGEGLVGERWNLYRRMTRGRLDDMFRAAFPRTRSTLGEAEFDDAIRAFLGDTPPTTPIFWRVGKALGDFVETRSEEGSLVRDLVRFERATWCVRHAPYAASAAVRAVDFDGVPELNPARESFDASFAVHEAATEGAPAELPSRIVVFRRDDKAASLSLNPLARAIFLRFEAGGVSVRDCVAAAAVERNARIDEAFVESLASMLAQWIDLGLLLGVRA